MQIQSMEELQALADAYQAGQDLLRRTHLQMSAYKWGDPRDELLQLIEDLSAVWQKIDGRRYDLLFGGTGTAKPQMFLLCSSV